MIVDANGRQATTAAEDIHLDKMKHDFREKLGRAIVRAMRESKDGKIALHMAEIEEVIDQAFFLGRQR